VREREGGFEVVMRLWRWTRGVAGAGDGEEGAEAAQAQLQAARPGLHLLCRLLSNVESSPTYYHLFAQSECKHPIMLSIFRGVSRA
jgi:hypothetical protein